MAAHTFSKRTFETKGNPIPGQHYLVENRSIVSQDGVPIRRLVDQGRYFTIFAPRQMGKTTFFVEFANELRGDPVYVPILLNFQIMKQFDSQRFYARIQQNLVKQLNQRVQEIRCKKASEVAEYCQNTLIENHASLQSFFADLNIILDHKKIVVFIDDSVEKLCQGSCDILYVDGKHPSNTIY